MWCVTHDKYVNEFKSTTMKNRYNRITSIHAIQKHVGLNLFPTCEVFGQVWMVHETMTCKLHTLQSYRHMDVIKPSMWKKTKKKTRLHLRSWKRNGQHLLAREINIYKVFICVLNIITKQNYSYWITISTTGLYWTLKNTSVDKKCPFRAMVATVSRSQTGLMADNIFTDWFVKGSSWWQFFLASSFS